MSIDFSAKQHEFAAFIRDPVNNPIPADVPPERMTMYRQLFFNNIDSFLSNNFPVLRQVLTDAQWEELVQDFFCRHTCRTPYFSEISEEFLEYLEQERQAPDDVPFLLELAHYEWVEMAVGISREQLPELSLLPEDGLAGTVYLSPLAMPLAYRYPVQKISSTYIPDQAPAQPTFIVVYRDSQDEVHFLELTPITYRLLEIIQEHEQGIRVAAVLKQLVGEMPQLQANIIMDGGLTTLKELTQKGIIFAMP